MKELYSTYLGSYYGRIGKQSDMLFNGEYLHVGDLVEISEIKGGTVEVCFKNFVCFNMVYDFFVMTLASSKYLGDGKLEGAYVITKVKSYKDVTTEDMAELGFKIKVTFEDEEENSRDTENDCSSKYVPWREERRESKGVELFNEDHTDDRCPRCGSRNVTENTMEFGCVDYYCGKCGCIW